MEKLDIIAIPRKFIRTDPVRVVFDPTVRALCRGAYAGHPKGCPNFGIRPDCPPCAPLFTRLYISTARIVAIRFNFGIYIEKRRERYPQWTDRALANPRHWQGHVRAELRRYVRELQLRDEEVIWNPEAMGIDVTGTCRKAGIVIEWPPQRYSYEIALIAKRK